MGTTQKLNKSAILELTDGGWKYFVKVFPKLKEARISDKKCRNIINHIRRENNASLYCYYSDKYERWILKDYGDPKFGGDIFSVYSKQEGTKNFRETLIGLYELMTGETPPMSNPLFEESELHETHTCDFETKTIEELSDCEQGFLDKYNLKYELMQEFQAHFLKSYTFRSKNGKVYKKTGGKGELIIGYARPFSMKIYEPENIKYKFRWIGVRHAIMFFGGHVIGETYQRLEKLGEKAKEVRPQLVICAGEKDTMVARSIGLNSFCLNSETTTYIDSSLIERLKRINGLCNGKLDLVILYDLDETGKECSHLLAKKFVEYGINARYVELPEKLQQHRGKDVADWIALGFSPEELVNLVNYENRLSSVSDISSSVEINPDNKKEDVVDVFNENDNRSLLDNLPRLFQETLKPFEVHNHQMMLMAFITVLGSIFRNVVGSYRRDVLFPNLYTIIIAPPASDKGLIKWARALIMPIERYLETRSKKALAKYQRQLDLVNKGKLDKDDVGEKPPYKSQLIPTDITSSKWLKQMSDNNGYGLMYDTEIDGLIESNNGKLRSFTDSLRKAYEGEPLSLMRKTDDERLLVEQGKMSLLLSGTPGQFFKLIPDAENGLFSRIIPYKFQGVNEWQNVFESKELDYNEYFKPLSEKTLKYFIKLYSLSDQVVFSLTKDQGMVFNKTFEQRLKTIIEDTGWDGRATVMRLGAITMKIAMIFSVVRRLDEDTLSSEIVCSDIDFRSALEISQRIMDNVMDTLRMMKNERVEHMYRGKKLDFFYALPNAFTFNNSQNIANECGVKLKTAEKWIYEFRNKGLLLNPEKGQFKKVA